MEIHGILKSYFGENIIETSDLDEISYLCNYNVHNIKVVIPREFPKVIPEFIIENYSKNDKSYTHIDSKGKICYISEDNLIWDSRNSIGLLSECCQKVIDVIESWETPQMKEELREEFLSYWGGLCSKSEFFNAKSFIEEFETFSKLESVIYKKSFYLFNDKSQLKDRITPTSKKGVETYFIPLRQKNNVIPPSTKKKLDSTTLKKMITGNLSSGVKRRFKKWCKKKRKKFILVLALPISEKNIILLGALFEYPKECIPLDGKVKDICKVTPLLIERHDMEYQVNRTSQDFTLTDKKVAVIGLGSVGSFVSSNLSKLGISKLFLIDHDYLSIDNISRHYLGMDSLVPGIQKVDALEERLRLENPMVDIEAEGLKFQTLVSKEATIFDEYDFIISCVGDTMTNFEINHFFRNIGKPVLYCWLDPYGIGHHTILVQPQFEGCYMCLNYENGNLVSNRLSFVAPNQKFEKRLASCASSFVPYNVVAPSQLANSVIEQFLLYINGKIQTGNVFSSQFGLSMQFDEQGYEYSNRYKACKADCSKLQSILQRNSSCPECNGEYNVC